MYATPMINDIYFDFNPVERPCLTSFTFDA